MFDSSSMDLANATLTTTSSPVPEPSAAALGLLSAALLLHRRRPTHLAHHTIDFQIS